ncbi:NXPE family member 3-like [Haliotis rufescens]|uniref:NXPE family member 3-like n=1 Tax=Haliotis rufescens TaxID=6454 RepID=UPI00201ED42D|nr:NXPE family member 3-like [Haliotis rufescens]
MYLKHNHTTFHLGDLIKVQINMYDVNGYRKLTGGDFLRVWMEDRKSNASVSGDVTDYNNGSYGAVIKATWAGHAIIRALINTRKEEIVLQYKIFDQYGSLWNVHATFVKNQLSETTICSTKQPSPLKQPEWCNLTLENSGLPWYCRRPSTANLTCDTWSYSHSSGVSFKLNNTERDILQWSRKDPTPDILPVTIKVLLINEDNKTTLTPPGTPCSRMLTKATWHRVSPTGFFHNNTWHPLQCTDTLPRTAAAYRECLKGKTIWLHGDSTSAQFKQSLHSFLHFPSHGHGHMPVTDTDTTYNFSVSWRAHEMPFYHGSTRYPRVAEQAQHLVLESLPDTSSDIVVLYLYVHFTVVHPDVFRQHVRRLVPPARKLLARAPNVTLAVRGPHTFVRSSKGLSSYWGLIHTDILHQEFSSLHHRVVYLNFWDLTMARPSYGSHPDRSIIQHMVHNMMSFVCFRT